MERPEDEVPSGDNDPIEALTDESPSIIEIDPEAARELEEGDELL
jgi:hypothetical protein